MLAPGNLPTQPPGAGYSLGDTRERDVIDTRFDPPTGRVENLEGRESLYEALSTNGNPKVATGLKVARPRLAAPCRSFKLNRVNPDGCTLATYQREGKSQPNRHGPGTATTIPFSST